MIDYITVVGGGGINTAGSVEISARFVSVGLNSRFEAGATQGQKVGVFVVVVLLLVSTLATTTATTTSE